MQPNYSHVLEGYEYWCLYLSNELTITRMCVIRNLAFS